jgi:hypothetical protein
VNKSSFHSPPLGYLAKLCQGLKNRFGKLNHKAFRFPAEKTQDGLLPPTCHDIQQISVDINQLREEIDPYDA